MVDMPLVPMTTSYQNPVTEQMVYPLLICFKGQMDLPMADYNFVRFLIRKKPIPNPVYLTELRRSRKPVWKWLGKSIWKFPRETVLRYLSSICHKFWD
jgi:hypothetical protein